jgi:hypothetical protein
MKILYYFTERDTYMYQWQRIHIFDELKRFGHEIEVFNPLSYESIKHANDDLIRYIKKKNIFFDLFMTCVGKDYLYKDTIHRIKSFGYPTLLICFDNLHAPYKHRGIADAFDLVWLTSKETLNMFKSWNCNNIIFQSYAANPFNFKPYWGKSDASVSFVGTPYGSRINKLNILTKNNIYCELYSDIVENHENKLTKKNKIQFKKLIEETFKALSFSIGRKVLLGALKNLHITKGSLALDKNKFLNILPSVSFLEMQKIYSNKILSLNITELRNTYLLNNPIHKMHLRTFEIPMCGGLEIASYTKELSGYFEEDKEIVFYRSEEELISKAKFYLNPKNEKLVLNMKKNARKRAEFDHTWMNRFNRVFDKI